MANAILKDALDITKAEILIDGKVIGEVTGLTISTKSPEDLIPVIGALIRRRKAETNEWSADFVFLYNNLASLVLLKGGAKFNIELSMANPNNASEAQKILVSDCTVNSSDINIGESSTYKMSGTCGSWSLV